MSVTVYKVFDASIPPDQAPPFADGVLGYVGRQGETPHVWDIAEWDRFVHLRQFPAWVPDLTDSAQNDALAAVDAVKSLGWAKMPQPETRAIVLDTEINENPGWCQAWAATVEAEGYVMVDYGSYNYVGANFASQVWAADWDGIPALVPGQTVGGNQYLAGVEFGGTLIDLSVVGPELWLRGGVGPRH